MDKIKFRIGNAINLPAEKERGTFYVAEDAKKIYLNDIVIRDTRDVEEVISKTFDTMNQSCGFNEDVQYTPKNEMLSGATNLSDALDIVADKAQNPTVDLSDYLTKTDASSTYATKDEVAETYLAKTDASSTYATKEEVTGTYLTKTDASSTYETKTRVAEIDETVSKSIDAINLSCGFNENIRFSSDNELLSSANSIAEALEILANEILKIKQQLQEP